jgi:hypothetical protein
MPARAKPSRIVQPASASVADHSIDPHPDPDAAATGDGLFGLSTAPSDARIVVIPVPFDATTSYRPRTARGAVPGNRTHARNSARDRERSKRASTRSSPVKRARSSHVAPD